MFLERQDGLPVNLSHLLCMDVRRYGNRYAICADVFNGPRTEPWVISRHGTEEEARRTLRGLVRLLALSGECLEWKDVLAAAEAVAEEERRGGGERKGSDGAVHREQGGNCKERLHRACHAGGTR